ncbi:MAG: PEP/pyruvate-binding domain-containing protein [Pseudomonadota bacterium]
MELPGRIMAYIRNHLLRDTPKSLSFTDLFVRFQDILGGNNRTMEIIADMEDKLSGQYVFDKKYMEDTVAELEKTVLQNAYNFNFITGNQYFDIYTVIETLGRQLKMELAGQLVIPSGQIVLALEDIQEVMDEAVGNKAYNLFRIMNLPQANVPASFVVSIGGFHKFLAFNNLFEKIEELLDSLKNGATVQSVSDTIRLLILNGDIPSDLRKEILKAAETICPKSPESGLYSVRSSAVGEDGASSFAGLHDSFLNVPYRELLSSYKKVLASMYNPGSLEYRLNQNMPLTDMAMAVLYQKMVSCKTAGVAYTVDPNSPQEQVCLLGANWGLGKAVVEGSTAVDTFRVSRKTPYATLEKRVNEKKWMMGPSETVPGTRVPPEMRTQPCLTEAQASSIVETILIIERFFKRPMDIEWCLDSKDRLRILQARPLGLPRGGQARSPELTSLLRQQKVLLKDQGIIAYRGVGSGPVWLVDDKKSLERFPSGAVLVARYGIPLLSVAIPRASAVITDVGSPTGHMATVAREFQIPTIVDTGSATQTLKNGQEITVDAERNTVYEGRINELLHHQLLERPLFEVRYEFQILRRLLRRISPLTLLDPEAPEFTARGCRTFHDIIRFIHEKSIQALLAIASKPSALLSRGGKRLKSNIPLNLILIDIGGGLDEKAGKGGWVLPEHIRSRPMKALWAGMDSENMWSTDPVPPDFKGLMSGVTRTQAAVVAGQTLTGLNVAVLGDNYMNLTLRVGYHFTVVDALMGLKPEKNNIFFRFLGGATDISRRSRRATLLVYILEKIGFKVEGNGDLVIARAVNSSAGQIKQYLYLIGRLIGFVRQLDVLMTDDSTVDLYFERFMTDNNLSSASDQTFYKEIEP